MIQNAPPGGVSTGTLRRAVTRHGLRHFTRLVAMLSAAPVEGRGHWLERRDARAKLAAVLVLALAASFLSSLAALVWCVGFSWLLMLSTGVSPRRYALFMATPLSVALFVTVPACLNLFTPGAALVRICSLPGGEWGWWKFPDELTITDHGVLVAARVILRVLAIATALCLLVATTRADRLWRALRGLGAPALVVALLSMMHRYLDLLGRVGCDMYLARLSRAVGKLSRRDERHWMAASIASLFRKTQALAGAIHAAMISRGYSGEIASFARARWAWPDTILLLAFIGVCALLLRVP